MVNVNSSNLFGADIQLYDLLVDYKKSEGSKFNDVIIKFPDQQIKTGVWTIEVGFSISTLGDTSNNNRQYGNKVVVRISTKKTDYREAKVGLDFIAKKILELVENDTNLSAKRPRLLTDSIEIKNYYDIKNRILTFEFVEDYTLNLTPDDEIIIDNLLFDLEVE